MIDRLELVLCIIQSSEYKWQKHNPNTSKWIWNVIIFIYSIGFLLEPLKYCIQLFKYSSPPQDLSFLTIRDMFSSQREALNIADTH